ncbi:MAG: sugar phosphate isomerase/epimerase [Ruminococcaceae bacterium]|nr:sugar phosphate isomerase/epimerase [Oscillospiraceae bacterium]
MRYGVCLGAKGKEYVSIIKKAGYDYIEGAFFSIKSMDKNTFDEFARTVKDNEIKVETFNQYFPKTQDIKVVGEDVNFSFLKDYTEEGMERAASLGGKIVVVGSGKTRTIPEGFSFERAMEQNALFLRFCGDIAQKYGIQIVIEPLNRGETNFINTVQDGIDVCKYTNHSNVFCLADFFHMYKNGETLEAIENSNGILKHVHIARANDDRAQPTMAEKDTCIMWSNALKKCGYTDRLTLESRFVPDFESAIVEALPAMKLFG